MLDKKNIKAVIKFRCRRSKINRHLEVLESNLKLEKSLIAELENTVYEWKLWGGYQPPIAIKFIDQNFSIFEGDFSKRSLRIGEE